MNLSYDAWAATTDPDHKKCVQEILQALYDKGEIYKATYRGFYSVRQEQFLTDKERESDGTFGLEWGEVIELEEENWYFRLAKHREWLLGFLDTHGDCVSPAFRQQELRNAAGKLSGDLSISRPKSRLSWGIELPFDPSCVTYVWFDALVNYISFAGYLRDEAAFKDRWPAFHVIGKDILIPAHGIYWLAMLKAMGFGDEEMPSFLVHGYVLIEGDKMSKSLGNIRDPNTFADTFGVEALRYYLMRDCVVGQDMDFTDERLIQRCNSDLANGLGNLLNRTLNMVHRYRGGQLSRSLEGGLRERADYFVRVYKATMEDCSINSALESLAELVTEANQFVEKNAPWKLGKDAGNGGPAGSNSVSSRRGAQADRDYDLTSDAEGRLRHFRAIELERAVRPERSGVGEAARRTSTRQTHAALSQNRKTGAGELGRGFAELPIRAGV